MASNKSYQFFGDKNLSFRDREDYIQEKGKQHSIYDPDETHAKIILSV